jgi:hypothetical protein
LVDANLLAELSIVPASIVPTLIVPEEPPHESEDDSDEFALPADLAEGALQWAFQIAAHAALGDQRRHTRMATILSAFACDPLGSIPKNTQNGLRIDSTYDFFKNRHFTREALSDSLGISTVINCSTLDAVYVVQDSTSYNFSSLTQTTGLGPLNDSRTARGLHAHNTIAVCPAGIVRGVLHIKLWARPPEKIDQKNKKKDDRPFAEKESYKWVEGLRSAHTLFVEHLTERERPKLIHVMDREGDIHEVLQEIHDLNDSAIIRCAQNRSVAGPEEYAHQAVHAATPLGTISVPVKACKEHVKHTAILEVRALEVTLAPHSPKHPQRQPLTVRLVEAWEPHPPAGSQPVCWRLWTFEPAATFAQAVAVINGYCRRWRVEEVHLANKSGCLVEKLELETADRLARAIMLYTAVAGRIVNLRDQGKHNPDAPCTVLLSETEWRVLQMASTKAPVPAAAAPPTLRQAMLWIGRLGGHLGRKRDGLPGIRTLWQGWQSLHLLVRGFQVSRLR